MKVVLDTSVFIAAVLKPSGGSGAILDRCREREVELLLSKSLVREIGRVLHKPKIQRVLRWEGAKISQFLHYLHSIAKIAPEDTALTVLESDPNDTIILACAVRGQADAIVSLDRAHLLSLHPFQGIPILTPKAFLEHFRNLSRYMNI